MAFRSLRDSDLNPPMTLRTLPAMVTLPSNALGADLIWWRTSQGMRTTVCVMWGKSQAFPDSVHLRAVLFNAGGDAVGSWRMALAPDQPIFIDSASAGPWREFDAGDGVLVLYACTDGDASEAARTRFSRLFPIVDWRAPGGHAVTLHSDQVIHRGGNALQHFTEIVAIEDPDETNALVFLNGEEVQPQGALEVSITNVAGISRSATYDQPMRPFSVNRIALVALFPDLVIFAGGDPILTSGTFASRGVRSRPYVETTGRRWGAYHAGNVYNWRPLPHFVHALIGGEVNPMAVLHDAGTRTFVNILHSHGDVDEDVDVDAALFDTQGACVARRPAWRRALRHGLARADIAELLPDPASPFRGHISLSFAPEPGRAVPRRLQALLEYRRAESVARVMAWSDEWNSKRRLAQRDRSPDPPRHRSWYRVWEDPDSTTELSITNAGHPGYNRSADVRVTLRAAAGPVGQTDFELAPFATRMVTVEELFPGAREALAPAGLGLALIESRSDLANVAFTRHRASGAIAAEHFLSLPSEHDGEPVVPSGS